jgi:serine/threonine-protein kinase RsbW
MGHKRVKFTIDSDLDQVCLIGMAVNKLCLMFSFSPADAYNMELCVVEAVTNSIKHSYGGEKGKEINVIFSLSSEHLTIDVCDYGIVMDSNVLENADLKYPDRKRADVEHIADSGRGIGIMKTLMDNVTYASGKEGNCLTLTKNIPPSE